MRGAQTPRFFAWGKMSNGLYKRWTTEEGQELLRGWKRKGLTDKEIAEKVGVNVSTLSDWKAKHAEIGEALKKGKEVCDFEAEEALIGLFEGHWVEDTITETHTNKDGIPITNTKTTKRWIEPNPTAIIFYLKCRAGWKEKGQEDQNEILKRFADVVSCVERKAHDRV